MVVIKIDHTWYINNLTEIRTNMKNIIIVRLLKKTNEETFSNKNVSDNLRNQIITVKIFCRWKKSLYLP